MNSASLSLQQLITSIALLKASKIDFSLVSVKVLEEQANQLSKELTLIKTSENIKVAKQKKSLQSINHNCPKELRQP